MTPSELLVELRARGVVVTPRGKRLCVGAPAGALSADLRAALREHWSEVLALVQTEHKAAEPPQPPGNRTPRSAPPAVGARAPHPSSGGNGNGTPPLAETGAMEAAPAPRAAEVPLPVARVLAALADLGRHLVRTPGGLAISDGPEPVPAGFLRQIERRQPEFLGFLDRTRFTKEELDALGFRGTKCPDGSGMYEVRVDGSVETLLWRLSLFGIEPEISDGALWLVDRALANNPEIVLPPRLFAEARARAGEIDRHLRAKSREAPREGSQT